MTTTQPTLAQSLRREWPLGLAVITLGVLLLARGPVASLSAAPFSSVLVLAGLCAVILACAVAIVRHAEVLAHRLGEPAGTLLLTLAVTGLEVAMVGLVMSTGDEKPTLARDTMYAVVMLVLNGFLGLALLLGGLRHGEQDHNLKGSNAFLIMIVPLTILGLVLPNFTRATPGPTLAPFQMIFVSVVSVAIYAIFLLVQNRLHRADFTAPAQPGEAANTTAPADRAHAAKPGERSTLFHALLLAGYALPLVLLAKQMSPPLDTVVGRLGAPVALGGLIMAVLVLTPESIAAIRAAMDNRLQRSVNILLGSVLASIGLTIPLVIVISLSTGRPLVLGLDGPATVMLVLTLATSTLTFALPRTNLLLGCVHMLLFAAYFMLLFD